MVGDNDAGAFGTYTQAGQDYGTTLLWTLVLLVPVLYVNQEMVLRLGMVTGVGHARLILEKFSRLWGAFSLIDLISAECADDTSPSSSASPWRSSISECPLNSGCLPRSPSSSLRLERAISVAPNAFRLLLVFGNLLLIRFSGGFTRLSRRSYPTW